MSDENNSTNECFYLVHRNDLTVSASSSTAFDAKSWTLTGLTYTGESGAAQMSTQCLCQTNGCRRLALTKRRWSNAGARINSMVTGIGSAYPEMTIYLPSLRCARRFKTPSSIFALYLP